MGVSNAYKHFFFDFGDVIDSLSLQIIYAQEGNPVDNNKARMMSSLEAEQYWSGMKGKAIAREISNFYSQYENQSWKNVISIGDSDFERLGTMNVMGEYARARGIDDTKAKIASAPQLQDSKLPVSLAEGEVDGHFYRVRTKTFKMLDEPTSDELIIQLHQLNEWLPFMVALDDGLDVNVDKLRDKTSIGVIDTMLRAKVATSSQHE